MEFQLNTCEREYAKDPKIKKEDIQQLTEWLQKEMHMPKADEYMMIQFYFASKYSLQQTKNLMDMHYTFRNEAPEMLIFPDSDKGKLKYSIWDIKYGFSVPQQIDDKRRIYYTSLRDFDAHKYNFERALAAEICIILTTILEEGVCPAYEIIVDMKGFSLPHFATITISLVRKLVYFAQDLTPLIIGGIHIINGYKMIDKFMFLAERFMKKELFEIIHIHSKPDDLFKLVPKEFVPYDIGGSFKQSRDELNDLMKAKVNAFEAAILKEYALKTDESKRIGGKKDITSMDGTFRKLELD